MKGLKNKIKKKQALMIVAFLFIIFCVFASASGLTHNITTFITSKIASAFNNQDEFVINRNNTPKINVSVNNEHTNATVEITNYPTDAISKQYRIDESDVWKDYTGEFTIKENTIIQTRYKKDGDEDYIEGSSKVVVEIDYNIHLQAPTALVKEGYTTIEQTKVATRDITVNFSSEDTKDKTIVYEVSVTRYPLNQEGLINDDGTVNVENVKNAENDSSYDRLETTEIYTKIDESNLKLSQSGVYKIKAKATTHGGFVKSEEVVVVTALDKVERDGLLTFKTEDGLDYTLGTWTQEKNVIVTLNTNSDIEFGNNNVTYSLSGVTTKDETAITSGQLAKIENHGLTTLKVKIKIGAITITNNYDIYVCKNHPYGAYKTITTRSCYTDGLKRRTCNNCGKVQDVKETAYGSHSPGSWDANSSYHWRNCTRCGTRLSYGSHSYTCTYESSTYKKYECLTCNKASYEEDIEPGWWEYPDDPTPTTCNHEYWWAYNSNYHWYYCGKCGVRLTNNESHNYNNNVCPSCGLMGTRCSICRYCPRCGKRT